MFNSVLLPGTVVDTDGNIKLEDVPIVTPNGDVVVPSLSFQVNKLKFPLVVSFVD